MSIRIDYSGQHVLVTGGAQGIGEAIVTRFAEAGARVTLADINGDQATRVAEKLTAEGHRVQAYAVDLSDEATTRAMIAVSDPIDVLVHNAGYFPLTPFEDLTLDQVERTFAVNVQSLFWMTQALLPSFKQKGQGVILCTSSVTGNRVAYPGLTHYAASKAAVNGFIRNTALEMGGLGIRINGVEPGMIRTPAMDNLGDDEHSQRLERGIPLGHLGAPEDIANAMLFLGSDLAKYITGQTIIVDGGALLPESVTALD
ncbi:SDR family oxidoreductase [Vreelandella neptunia]|uniref:SDR family oxidoreductase n=1 Tax=Vreelandella neptunia TaxID=115551 RepID=A0ABZ0YL16_9GAMM|nr:MULTISPECIES: SDR family oxidoreductase [Halomonas]MBF58839.1 3-ketoacyl-ACP reductase [Halomonas sp.]MDN3560248.1 SDR family oxidoreductase [Halomonas neptunia]WQH12824.1 SDR family oxidoreductase [Halomonas neptunia]|tara:strand:- start:1381 stop:2151 length:771 start_codon:yes stop_codon:yes gene_type:complete